MIAEGGQLVLPRVNGVSLEQYSLSSKLRRSRVLLINWSLWWQHKSLKLKIFCCDSRLRLLKMIYTVLGILALGWCLQLLLHMGFFSLVYRVFLLFFSLVHVCVIICAVFLLMKCISCFCSFFSLVRLCVSGDSCCFPSDVCYFVQDNNTYLWVAGSPRW